MWEIVGFKELKVKVIEIKSEDQFISLWKGDWKASFWDQNSPIQFNPVVLTSVGTSPFINHLDCWFMLVHDTLQIE